MKTSMLSALAGAVFLASGAMASAGEPVKLGPAELDSVTAGRITIDLSRTAIAAVSQELTQRNSARVDVDQDADARSVFGDATATNNSQVTITQENRARQTNFGSAFANAGGDN